MTDSEKTDYSVLTAKLCAIQKFIDERDRRYEERFKSNDEKTGLALSNAKEAVTKAETATEKRFDAVNEFRGTLSDQAATLLPRAEAAARFTSYDEKIDEIKRDILGLRESRSQSQGKSSGFNAAWAVTVSVMFLVIAVVGLILTVVGLISKIK